MKFERGDIVMAFGEFVDLIIDIKEESVKLKSLCSTYVDSNDWVSQKRINTLVTSIFRGEL